MSPLSSWLNTYNTFNIKANVNGLQSWLNQECVYVHKKKELRYDECTGKMKEKLDWNFIVFIMFDSKYPLFVQRPRGGIKECFGPPLLALIF